jgi:LacI family repressor for deo operon, udp, cdd, tsx, nupC, and nupG
VTVHYDQHEQDQQVKHPTIRDVATLAGVSHQTVSRVINEADRVLPETRKRVLAAIGELGYEPNAVAQSLASNRTHAIGMMAPDISDHAFGQAAAGAEREARQRGFFLIVGSVEDEVAGDEPAYLRLMLQRRVEGLIVARPSAELEESQLLAEAAARVPLVAIAPHRTPRGVSVVDVDNRRGGLEATAYLLGQGHRQIATITGPIGWASAAARLDGYRRALRDAAVAEDPRLIVTGDDWTLTTGEIAAEQLIAQGHAFTAIFAQSDQLALGAISALRTRGLRVPDDVSVIGYDDIPVARFVDPPLTTIQQPMREVGAAAAAIVIDGIRAQRAGEAVRPVRQRLRAPLIVRGTVAPPRASEVRLPA